MRAYQCDWDGKLYEGEPKNNVTMDFDANTRLEVKLMVKRDGRWVEGDLGPTAVDVVRQGVEPHKAAFLARQAAPQE